MNILILNWRDMAHPSHGGAELLTHEIAKGLVKKGHFVTQISSGFYGSKEREVVDGVMILRMGRWYSVHLLAFFYYVFHLRKSTNVIIDEVHWFPFFSKLYAPQKTVLLACEVAHELFYRYFSMPFSWIGRQIEKVYISIYKTVPTLAISPSTKRALVKEGFPDTNITVVPMGVSGTIPKKLPKKESKQTLIFLGRLSESKGVEHAIQAVSILKNELPDIQLFIVGTGEKSYVAKLKQFVSQNDLISTVHFKGYVSEQKKFDLLARAHVLLMPSQQEGWGLVIPEAGLVKTPAVAYNVEGIRDIIADKKNGILVSESAQSLADGVMSLLTNEQLYRRVQKGAYDNALSYSWENCVAVTESVLTSIYEKYSH